MPPREKKTQKQWNQKRRFVFAPDLAKRSFGLPLEEYRLANWNRREFFLPGLPQFKEESTMAKEALRMTREGNIGQLELMLQAALGKSPGYSLENILSSSGDGTLQSSRCILPYHMSVPPQKRSRAESELYM